VREFHSRPARRVTQGHHDSGGEPGRPFLPLASFGRAKEGNQLPVCHRENYVLHYNAGSNKE
jgi:hypothetical protein